MAQPLRSRRRSVFQPKVRLPHGAVFLIGFMGAGKTTTGRRLARRLGWRFVDLDKVIEAHAGRTVAEIFRDSGEASFRRSETAALRHVLGKLNIQRPMVVALGGGAIVLPRNRELVRQSGAPVIFLDAEIEELRRRCRRKSGARPLFQDENQFRQLYAARRGAYMAAGVRVETTSKTSHQVAAEIVELLLKGAQGEMES